MADMKVEEAERRAQGLPTEREKFGDSDDEDVAEEEDEEDESTQRDTETPDERMIDMTRARRIQDSGMEADGSKWPRPR